VGVPRLAVEIISPSTARNDRMDKRRRYQPAGVATYWIFDLDLQLVEEWGPTSQEPMLEYRTLRWQPDAGIPVLEIDLDRFFRAEWQASGSPGRRG
jgi:Uma2 family endonuclease